MKFSLLFFFVFISLNFSFAQKDVDISSYLSKIDGGKIDEVKKILLSLKKQNPNSPSVIYLEALLTSEGDIASKLYKEVIDHKQPSEYKDDAMFKLYQYHYALGDFDNSDKYARMLVQTFPNSNYVSRLGKSSSNPADGGTEIGTKSKFGIQVGAFVEKRNAESLRSQVMRYGNVQILEKEVKGKLFYTVIVIGCANEYECGVLKERIKNEINISGVVVQLN